MNYDMRKFSKETSIKLFLFDPLSLRFESVRFIPYHDKMYFKNKTEFSKFIVIKIQKSHSLN